MNNLMHQLAAHRGFVVYRLAKLPGGKLDKIPVDPITGYNSNAQNPATWMLPEEARLIAEGFGADYGVGLVIYQGSNLFCVDLDHCIDDQGVKSAHAVATLAKFAGAYVEVSASGTGLHIFGCYRGILPPHKSKNSHWATELYSTSRFIALTGTDAQGALIDCTEAVTAFAAEYFPKASNDYEGEWTDGPAEGWDFIRDDDELLKWARDYKNVKSIFGGKAPIWALMDAHESLGEWFEPNSPGQLYDASSADQSLANFFAWATGNNCERVATLMRRTALARSKWDTRDDYFNGTIAKACAGTKSWPTLPKVPQAPAAGIVAAQTVVTLPTPLTVLHHGLLRTNLRHDPIADEENVRLLLEHEENLRGISRFNEFSGELILVRPITSDRDLVSERGLPRPWSDADTATLQTFIQKHYIPKIAREKIDAIVAMHARQRSAFHPVRDYLQSLVWDGTPRLDTWMRNYWGAAKQPAEYLAAVGVAWMISGVARIMQPGCQADYALVLEGSQGVRKSTALRSLAGDDYFSDSLPADLSHKDARDHLRGKWIVELPELAQFKRNEIETVKAFITRRHEQYRPSYGRHEIRFPRQCIFAGSTNDEAYLVDTTGNRRFWVIACGRVDLEALKRDRDQLWAEAAARYRKGERWHLTQAQEAMAAVEAASRVAHDPWTSQVAHIVVERLGSGQDVSPGEVMEHMNLPTTERHARNAGRVGSILMTLEWKRGKRDRTRGQLYARPAIPLPPLAVKL